MGLHPDGARCIGRWLLLPGSTLRTLCLDELQPYGPTLWPKPPHAERPRATARPTAASRRLEALRNSAPPVSAAVRALLPFVQRAPKLLVLSLRCPSPPLFGDEAEPEQPKGGCTPSLLDELCNALYVNSSLTRLLLEGNAVSVRGAALLLRAANGRRKRCVLQELNLTRQAAPVPTAALFALADRSGGAATVIDEVSVRCLELSVPHDPPTPAHAKAVHGIAATGQQRGRRDLPGEADARLLDLNDEDAFARAATEAIRNNKTVVKM